MNVLAIKPNPISSQGWEDYDNFVFNSISDDVEEVLRRKGATNVAKVNSDNILISTPKTIDDIQDEMKMFHLRVVDMNLNVE